MEITGKRTVKYIQSKEFKRQLVDLKKRGGKFQKASESILQILGSLNVEENPLDKIPVTNHGENRIKHCVKYDLQGWCRLVTIQNNGFCLFAFTGTHEDCDRWLDENRGLELATDKQEITPVYKSEDINNPRKRIKDGDDLSEKKLLSKLGEWYVDFLAERVSGKIFMKMDRMGSEDNEDDIIEICQQIEDENLQGFFFDVLIAAKSGKIDEAKNRIRLFKDELILLEAANEEVRRKLESNDQYVFLDDFRGEDLKTLLYHSNWYDWMLFMHPSQRKVAEADFPGTSRLLGVSGSGKTCVVVNRAIRLTRKYPGEKILITTINSALAKLISELVEVAISYSDDYDDITKRLKIKSFGELCKEMLVSFETDPIKKRSYDQYTDKHHDDFDEIWNEFYLCENNNEDARVLFPVHKSLLSRGIYPMEYIRQEFDWIRSALGYNEREDYLDIQREGRIVNFSREYRKQVLEGLKGWEDKMVAVGVSDFLGLLKPLNEYIDFIEPEYRCILVDELQDFGTAELKIIRKLVNEAENDLFLCGDIAQQVYTKHHRLSLAGIKIRPGGYLRIEKNYRNGREILEAASHVFHANVTEDMFKTEDFELIDAKYANFSSPKPFLRKAESLAMELNYSLDYLETELTDIEKGCIALCGFSFFDIKNLGRRLDLPVLDGDIDLKHGKVFLSDLEQTKGFEFDRMIIINCEESVFPNSELPREEWFREISKMYVAMTRAKKDLVVSFHDSYSLVFESSLSYFTESVWSDYVENPKIHIDKIPKSRETVLAESIENMTGTEFLYTRLALNFSPDALDRLETRVTKTKIRDHKNKRDTWRNLKELKTEIRRGIDTPNIAQKFGPAVLEEIKQKLNL